MSELPIRYFLFLVLVITLSSCANMIPPAGGPRDTTPPLLLSVTPSDSSLNTKVNRIEMHFDEFVTLNNATSEITISPMLPFPIVSEANLKKIVVKIPDSLLHANTTYRISFGKAIQDVHENNPYKGYRYTFSTGPYFDSLKLNGIVVNAATGKTQNNAIVLIYDGALNDSCIVRQKPIYVTKTENNGTFSFDGLPPQPLKIFALIDNNNNLIYDGKDEFIAFSDTNVIPTNKKTQNIILKIFSENDSIEKKKSVVLAKRALKITNPNDKTFTYLVKVDTTDIKKRTKEITEPIFIETTKPLLSTNVQKVSLFFDSLGIFNEASFIMHIDSLKKDQINIETNWKENTVYILKLLKGFVKDSLGTDALPSKYYFKTKRKDDYAQLIVHLPQKYYTNKHLLELIKDDESIYLKPISDTMTTFNMLVPAIYSLRIIEDQNENGIWDHGYLFNKIQPENVIPYTEKINLKSGWENIIDFEEEKGKYHKN